MLKKFNDWLLTFAPWKRLVVLYLIAVSLALYIGWESELRSKLYLLVVVALACLLGGGIGLRFGGQPKR